MAFLPYNSILNLGNEGEVRVRQLVVSAIKDDQENTQVNLAPKEEDGQENIPDQQGHIFKVLTACIVQQTFHLGREAFYEI